MANTILPKYVFTKAEKREIAISKMISVFERMLEENMLSHYGEDLVENTIKEVKQLLKI